MERTFESAAALVGPRFGSACEPCWCICYRPDDKLLAFLKGLRQHGLCPGRLRARIGHKPDRSATGHSPARDRALNRAAISAARKVRVAALRPV
jgi:hypothetical protein